MPGPGRPDDDVQPASMLPRWLILFLACEAGGVVANTYYSQPLLSAIADSLHVESDKAVLVPAASLAGYAVGMLLLAPLGDRFDRRRIILWQFAVLVPALIAMALSPNLSVFLVASFAVGVSATIVQQIITLCVTLSPPGRAGEAVGTVMAGLTAGILLSRPTAGLIASELGWRGVFALGAGFAFILALAAWRALPSTVPHSTVSYVRLLASLPGLLAEHRMLRLAATSGLLWAASFNAFWAALAFHLSAQPFMLSSRAIGLLSLAAVGGALASRPAGRMADRYGAKPVICLGLGMMVAAFALMGIAHSSLPALVVGIVLLDAGVFTSQVGNQSLLLRIQGAASSRMNAIYMVCYCAGGAIGAALAGMFWLFGGWSLVCAAGSGACMLALALQLLGQRPDRLHETSAPA